MQLHKVNISAGQEVLETLSNELKKLSIQNGAIVSIIGAVDQCCISNMPKQDASQDILTEYNEPMELSGCGEIIDGVPHIHCILGREGDASLSGHLHWAKVQNWYVNIFITPMENS